MNAELRLPQPFLRPHRVGADEIDAYLHVNNTVYLRWLDRIAWEHSAQLGLPIDACLSMRRGMAVRHTRVDYLQAAQLGDDLTIGTWIVASDRRLRCTRRFDVRRVRDHARVLEAEIDYFSMNLDTGKPSRFPPEFVRAYAPLPEVAAAYLALPKTARQVGRWRP